MNRLHPRILPGTLRHLLVAPFLALLLAALAPADAYVASFSGGTVATTQGSPGGPYGASASGCGGSGSGVTAKCSGAITATFAWSGPNGTAPTTPAPADAVLLQTCVADARGVGGPAATADDGLGDAPVSQPGGIVTSGHGGDGNPVPHYSVVASGASFSVTCSPSASSSHAPASVTYTASATPVTLTLSGGIADGDGRDYLVGQQCVGTVTAPYATTYQWTVAGSRPFKSYDPTAASNQLIGMGAETGSSVTTHFAAAGDAALTCNVSMMFPDGTTGATTVTKNATIELPSPVLASGVIGSVLPAPVVTPYSGAQLIDCGDSTHPDEGVVFRITVTTPTKYGGGGTGAWNQLISLGTTQTVPAGTLRATVGGATSGLNDGGFPYSTTDPGTFTADSAVHLQSDAPYYTAFDGDSTAYNISDSFKMYVLYEPPGSGSMYVPVGYFSWGWTGSASRPLHGSWPAPSGSGSGPSWNLTATHPTWSVTAGTSINWQP